MAKRSSAEQKTEHYGLWSSCFLGTQRAVPLEHMEQLLPSALPGAQSSSSGALWRVRAHMAALLGTHIQQISFSEHIEHASSMCSTGAHGLSSCFPGEPRAALLEHVEQ